MIKRKAEAEDVRSLAPPQQARLGWCRGGGGGSGAKSGSGPSSCSGPCCQAEIGGRGGAEAEVGVLPLHPSSTGGVVAAATATTFVIT
jgi:hypothetical protein